MKKYNISKGRKAAAIAYKPPQPAPQLVAVGKGREAALILAEARKAGIAIVEDPGLAAMLEAARPGDYIPAWCWEAVAGILAFVLAREKGKV
ncbi:MAG: EscU/YscU/HrcU family type III secretion system export apparatus switch protein [Spirochaetaceae bacterium]|jgi:flagellar biosynthesis protein|nr:EscU/YscU/HrcU family type III secretion system export apparatus switch protein [Spirochaetaceae bacterium]